MKTEGQKSGESSATDGTPDRPRKKTSTPKPSLKIGSFYPTLNDVSLMAISSSDDDEENEIAEFLQSHSMVPLDNPVQKVAAEVNRGGSDSSVLSPAMGKSATKRKRKTPSKQRSNEIAQGMSPVKIGALQQANSSHDSSSPRRKSSSKKKMSAIDDKVMKPSEISETVTPSSSSDNENDQNNGPHKSHSLKHEIQGFAQILAAQAHRESSDSSFQFPAMGKSVTKKKRKTPAKSGPGAIGQEMSPLILGTNHQSSSSQVTISPRKKPSSKRKSAIVDDHVTQAGTVSESFSLSSSCDDDEKHQSKERHKRPSSKQKIHSDVSVQNVASEIHMERSDTSLKLPAVEKSATKKKQKTPSKQPPGASEQGMSPLSTLNRESSLQSNSPKKKTPSKKNKPIVDLVLPSRISERVLSSSDSDENIQNEEPHKSQSSKDKIHSNAPVQKLAERFRSESSDTLLNSPAVQKSATKRKRKTPAKLDSGAIKPEMSMPNLGALQHANSSQDSPPKKSPSKRIKSTVDVVLPSEISERAISSSNDSENNQNEEPRESISSKAKITSNVPVQKLATEFHGETSLKSLSVEKSATKRKRKTPAKSASGAIKNEMSTLDLGAVQHAISSQENGNLKKKSSKKNKSTVDLVLPSKISERALSSSNESEIILNTPVQKLAPQFNRESSDTSLNSPAVQKSATKRNRKAPAKSASGAIKVEMSQLNLGTLQHASNSQESSSPKKKYSKKNTSTVDVVVPSEISECAISSSDDSENNQNGEPHNSSLSSKLKIHSNTSVHMESSESIKSPAAEKSATKRKRKTPAKSASIKHEMSPLNLGTLHQASRSENGVSPRKTSPSKKKAAIGDDHVDRPSDILETLRQTLSQHPVKAERGTDHVDTPGHQVDASSSSDDSSASDSSSLADSSFEDEEVVTATVVQPAAPEPTITEDRPEEESTGGDETTKQIRFTPPEHYGACSLLNTQLSKEDSTDSELWLIKVPYDFDVTEIDNKTVTIGGALMMKKTTGKDGVCRVWELEASYDDTLEKSNWCVMLPGKNSKQLCPVGPLKGQISMTKSVQPLPYVIPPVPTKHVHMPKGLKIRNVPFGANAPVMSWTKTKKKKKKKDRESSHGGDGSAKKHKKRRHLQEVG